MNKTQGAASANSYARRYALMNALSLVTSNEDDDGFRASADTISNEDAAILRDDIQSMDRDELAFCNRLGVECLEDLPRVHLGKARNLLKSTRRQIEKDGGK